MNKFQNIYLRKEAHLFNYDILEIVSKRCKEILLKYSF